MQVERNAKFVRTLPRRSKIYQNRKIMELNFNSVEMSSKPNAEASSLDYAEAPLTFNSVETIPVLNASAAFKTDSGKVFKEDVDIVPTIIDIFESDETL